MSLESELADLQRKLNAAEFVDGRWFRRNHGAYELVCYVNILSGLLSSKNYEGVETQVSRIKEFLAAGGGKYVTPAYVLLVNELLEYAGSDAALASDNSLQGRRS